MTVQLYLDSLPEEQRRAAGGLREAIRAMAPNAVEHFAYGMPAYKLNGKPFVYFAAYKNHLGVYALPAAHAQFAKELAGFKQGKGSVQFPWTQPLPMELFAAMLRFNIARIEAG